MDCVCQPGNHDALSASIILPKISWYRLTSGSATSEICTIAPIPLLDNLPSKAAFCFACSTSLALSLSVNGGRSFMCCGYYPAFYIAAVTCGSYKIFQSISVCKSNVQVLRIGIINIGFRGQSKINWSIDIACYFSAGSYSYCTNRIKYFT